MKGALVCSTAVVMGSSVPPGPSGGLPGYTSELSFRGERKPGHLSANSSFIEGSSQGAKSPVLLGLLPTPAQAILAPAVRECP